MMITPFVTGKLLSCAIMSNLNKFPVQVSTSFSCTLVLISSGRFDLKYFVYMGTGDFFSGGKTTGMWSWPLTSI